MRCVFRTFCSQFRCFQSLPSRPVTFLLWCGRRWAGYHGKNARCSQAGHLEAVSGNRKEKTRSEFYNQCLRCTLNDITSPNKPKPSKFLCPLNSSIGMTFQMQTAVVTGAPSLRLAAFKKMFAYPFEDNCFVRGSMHRYLLLFSLEE